MHHGSIRNAALHDADEVARLAHRDLVDLIGHGHLLVLDLHHGALGGVVHVDDEGMVDVLAVEPDLAAEEDRLTSVAHALAAALRDRGDDTGRWETAGRAFCVALQAG